MNTGGAPVLLVANVGWFSVTSPTGGTCRLTVDGSQTADVALPGETVDVTDSTHQGGAGLNTVVITSNAFHTFALQCNQTQGDINMPGTWLSAVKLSG
jgi:hypothetical protein